MPETADNPHGVPKWWHVPETTGMMTFRRAIALTTCVVALAVTASCSLEQVMLGQWYTIHTIAAGTCPALDWHFVVDAHKSIGGYLDRDQFKQIAALSGTLNADDSFQIWATEDGGSRKESVTGAFTSQAITLSLDGTWICEKQTFRIRPIRAPGPVGGGGGGG